MISIFTAEGIFKEDLVIRVEKARPLCWKGKKKDGMVPSFCLSVKMFKMTTMIFMGGTKNGSFEKMSGMPCQVPAGSKGHTSL
ncbi:hypothetical protein [Methanomethylovorans sp.]|uniref:hypothetical protein n=1 Tax=Methanomethylovorans sp. TaxID=2758717 RepID=UPI003D0B4B7B